MNSHYSVSPYSPNEFKHLNYSKATPDKNYIKILKYVYDNPKTKKVNIVTSVFSDSPVVKAAWLADKKPATTLRGYAVTYFGQLVNDDLLLKEGTGHNVTFTITDAGIELLKQCGAI